MTREIHDYDRSAHAHTMRMIDIGSDISQLHNNSTCVSCFGGNLSSLLKSCDFNFELSINWCDFWRDYHVYSVYGVYSLVYTQNPLNSKAN